MDRGKQTRKRFWTKAPDGDYTEFRWLWNSSRISIRILVVNAAAADCGILMEFSKKSLRKVWASDFSYSGAVHVFFTNN